MKMFVALLLVAAASAAPQFDPQFTSPVQPFQPEVRIVSQKFEQDQVGNYEYGYQQDNGQQVQEVGRVAPGSQPETGSLEQQGSFEFIGDDGNTYRVDYTANEGGFQPQAPHLPVAPAQIPEYAQLRQEHPELFWAENGGAVIQQQQQFGQTQQFF